MVILITGASGFIGSHVARRMRQMGHELIILKRPSSDLHRIEDLLTNVRTCDWVLEDPGPVFEANPGVQAVIHTATCYGRSGETGAEVLEVNTAAPLRLL